MMILYLTHWSWIPVLVLLITSIVLAYLYYTSRVILRQWTSKSHIREQENQKLRRAIETLERQRTELDSCKVIARLADQSRNAIMLMDASGYILWVNQGFARMYEYTYEEFIAARGNNIKKTSFSKVIHERLTRCVEHGEPVIYDALNITRTGKEIWTQTLLTPVFDEQGQIVNLATIDADIHDRKIASDKLVQYLLNLNQQVNHLNSQFSSLANQTGLLFSAVQKTSDRVQQTGGIVEVIRSVAENTKLLGINASIEAHTSGIHGHGFRVIAREIVDVSESTRRSVKGIKDLLEEVKMDCENLSEHQKISSCEMEDYQLLVNEINKELKEMEEIIYRVSN